MGKCAYIVGGGSKERLEELLKQDRERVVIGVDGGALALLEAKMAVDVAIGDFDSISEAEFQLLTQRVPSVIQLPEEKDLTDTEAALQYVAEELEVDEVIMLGLFGGRLDHMMSNLWLAYQPRFQKILSKVTIMDHENTLRFYQPGEYELHHEPGKKYLSFIGMSAITSLRLEKVKYPLAGNDFPYPTALVSNEFQGETMSFSFEDGLLAVIQSKDK